MKHRFGPLELDALQREVCIMLSCWPPLRHQEAQWPRHVAEQLSRLCLDPEAVARLASLRQASASEVRAELGHLVKIACELDTDGGGPERLRGELLLPAFRALGIARSSRASGDGRERR